MVGSSPVGAGHVQPLPIPPFNSLLSDSAARRRDTRNPPWRQGRHKRFLRVIQSTSKPSWRLGLRLDESKTRGAVFFSLVHLPPSEITVAETSLIQRIPSDQRNISAALQLYGTRVSMTCNASLDSSLPVSAVWASPSIPQGEHGQIASRISSIPPY